MDERLRGIAVVTGKSARGLPLEAEDPVASAHPVLIVPTEAALATRDNLLGDHAVADRDPVPFGRALAEHDDPAGVLVAGDAWTLKVAALAVRTPKDGIAEPRLHVGGTDAAGAD